MVAVDAFPLCMDVVEVMVVREDIPRKKPLTFGHCPKGGWGFNPNPKVFGVVFWGLSFGHFPKRVGGVEPIPKVLG